MHILMFWLAASGCSLRSVLPSGSVLSREQIESFADPRPSNVAYKGPPGSMSPVLPLTAFGLTYSVDVVLVSQHPDWDMHEYARLDLPTGPLWIAKDSDHDGRQTIVADVDDIQHWLAEIPAPRISQPMTVRDDSKGDIVDVELTYTNPKGQLTEVWAKGTMARHPPRKRNGNTMGHSRDAVAAVLDLERFSSDIDGGIRIDGEDQKIARILGLVPFRYLLRQTQAGLAVASFRQTSTPEGFKIERPIPGTPDWPTSGTESWTWDGQTAQFSNELLTYAYTFKDRELVEIKVAQLGRPSETFHMQFQPALPDLRRPFEGEARSRFVMHVAGQPGHGTGMVVIRSTGEQAELEVHPSAPHWLRSRPMKTSISGLGSPIVDVTTHMYEP